MLLNDEADELAARPDDVRSMPDRLAVNQHAAGGGLVKAADQVQQRALARSRPSRHDQ
jgi:hypothetical protein